LACCPFAPMNGQLMLEFPDHFWVTAQARLQPRGPRPAGFSLSGESRLVRRDPLTAELS
jgi:hypothetical protein